MTTDDQDKLVASLQALSKTEARMIAEKIFAAVEDTDKASGLDHFIKAMIYQIYLFHKVQS